MAAMGKVINVIPINNSTSITIANCVENMIATVRSKLLEVSLLANYHNVTTFTFLGFLSSC